MSEALAGQPGGQPGNTNAPTGKTNSDNVTVRFAPDARGNNSEAAKGIKSDNIRLDLAPDAYGNNLSYALRRS